MMDNVVATQEKYVNTNSVHPKSILVEKEPIFLAPSPSMPGKPILSL